MKQLHPSRSMIVGLVLTVVANALLLGAAMWNRLGDPTSTLSLIEGELELPRGRSPAEASEDSGISLALLWHGVPRWSGHLAPERATKSTWLDREKLREIGFDVAMEPTDPAAQGHYQRMLPRPAYVVLELNEEARQDRLQEQRRASTRRGAEESRDQWIREVNRRAGSRLFAIDAGTDARRLQRQYPDGTRFAVVPGVIRVQLLRADEQQPALAGVIEGLRPERIQVPQRLRNQIGDLGASRAIPGDRIHELPPRFRATVAFGRRYEPWLVDLERLEDAPEEPPTRPVKTTSETPSVDRIEAQCVPDLLEPEEGATLDNGSTNQTDTLKWAFRWSPCPESTGYHLFVSGPGARYPFISEIVDRWSTSYVVDREGYVADKNRHSWTWKVKAKIGNDWGPWSAERFFDVESLSSTTRIDE